MPIEGIYSQEINDLPSSYFVSLSYLCQRFYQFHTMFLCSFHPFDIPHNFLGIQWFPPSVLFHPLASSVTPIGANIDCVFTDHQSLPTSSLFCIPGDNGKLATTKLLDQFNCCQLYLPAQLYPFSFREGCKKNH